MIPGYNSKCTDNGRVSNQLERASYMDAFVQEANALSS